MTHSHSTLITILTMNLSEVGMSLSKISKPLLHQKGGKAQGKVITIYLFIGK